MKKETQISLDRTVSKIGYYVVLFGTVLILLWIGLFKFTPTEALAIKPLVENHPLSSWLYDVLTVQAVSNLIGAVEIIVAITLVISIRWYRLRRYAAMAVILIFIATLSFLFTTPGMWRSVDGMPVTDFFILKDIAFLGFGMMLFKGSNNKNNK